MKKLFKNKTAVKYLLTGGAAFTFDYLLLICAYYLLSLPLWVATSIGYFGGLCISFFVNRTWVYGNSGKQRKMTRQLVEYVSLLAANYIFTVYAVNQLNDFGIEPTISKIAVTGIIVCWNYLIFSKFIFSSKESE